MSFLPPMTGNGTHTIYKNGDDWGMLQMALVDPQKNGDFFHFTMGISAESRV
jgi:hypothetical protein